MLKCPQLRETGRMGMVRQGDGYAMVLALAALMPAAASAQVVGTDAGSASAEVLASSVYTDNFYYDTADEPQADTIGFVVVPRAGYKTTKGRLDLLARIEGEVATFDLPGSADDYEDARIGLNSSWLATRRGRLDLRAGFDRSHDPFGINRTEDATVRDAELDIWHSLQAGALFHYGAPEATLNTEVGVSALQKSYQTNEAATRFLDYTSTAFSYTVFYNLSPKTATLFDFVRTNVQFDESFGALDARDGDEYRLRTGLRWLASGKTSGDLRVGVFRREFDNSPVAEEGLDWQLGLQWAPRARTLLELEGARGSQESYRIDTRVNITRSVTLRWKQYWGARASSQLSAGHATTDFIGLGRKDTAYNVRLGLDYMLSRSLSAVASAETYSRTSNDSTSEFDRLSAFAGVRLVY
jgi:hypothetical protein